MSARTFRMLLRSSHQAYLLKCLNKKYTMVDFRTIQGFQPAWKTQKGLSLPQRDMTLDCLLHFNFDVPTLVRWIRGPHAGAHCNVLAILQKLETTCQPTTVAKVRRIFTLGSPKFCNAHCNERNFQAYRTYGNHKTIQDPLPIVYKTMAKEVNCGNVLTLNPASLEYLCGSKTTANSIVNAAHLFKDPRLIFDSLHRPEV